MKNLDDLIGLSVKNVYCEKSNSATSGYDQIILELSDCYFKLIVDNETDEIIYRIFTNLDISQLKQASWSDQIVNKIVGQTWGLENDKKYSDLICIGLNDVIPTILFSVIASEIKVAFVNYLTKEDA